MAKYQVMVRQHDFAVLTVFFFGILLLFSSFVDYDTKKEPIQWKRRGVVVGGGVGFILYKLEFSALAVGFPAHTE